MTPNLGVLSIGEQPSQQSNKKTYKNPQHTVKGFYCQIPLLGKSVVNPETSEIARFMVKYRPPIQLEFINTLYKNQFRLKCHSL